MKLVLHIGASGLVGLSDWLARQRAAFALHGILLPVAFGERDHGRLVKYALLRSHVTAAEPGTSPFDSTDAQDAYRKFIRADFEREVAQAEQAGMTACLLSDGTLFHEIASFAMAERVRDLLAPLFDAVVVVVHLRPQLELLPTEAARHAKAGRMVTHATIAGPNFGPQAKHLNYNILVERWEKVFGGDNVSIVPFHAQPNIVEPLCRELGLDPAVFGPDRPRETPPPGWRAIAFANAVNQFSGSTAPLAVYFDEIAAPEPLLPDAALATFLQNRFFTSNAKLCARRSDVRAADLKANLANFEGEPTLALAEAPCMFSGQIAELLARMESRLCTERYLRLLAEARQAVAEDRIDALPALKTEIDRMGAMLSARLRHTAAVEA